MVGQKTPQRIDGAGVVTGSLQLGELVPHRADNWRVWGWLASLATVRVDRCHGASTLGIGVVKAAGSLPRWVGSVVVISNRLAWCGRRVEWAW
ncbi:MAG TPA: hypothetical protein VGO16_03640 [Pseudonocardiaceae bacterium]|nr:hypothetical protein [Pseudonocardiaceae bacterium]